MGRNIQCDELFIENLGINEIKVDPWVAIVVDLIKQNNDTIEGTIVNPHAGGPRRPRADKRETQLRKDTKGRIAIRVAKDVELEKFILRVHSPIVIPNNVWFSANYTKLSSTKHIHVHPMFRTEYASIETGDGDIKGKFPIHRSLDLQSRSGNIDAEIIPQRTVERSGVVNLKVLSQAGYINIQYPPEEEKVPEFLVYHTEILGFNVKGRYLLGEKTNIEAFDSGVTKPEPVAPIKPLEDGKGYPSLEKREFPSLTGELRSSEQQEEEEHAVGSGMNVEILPVAQQCFGSHLKTHTQGGDHYVKLLAPQNRKDNTILTLDATHDATSGIMAILYPKCWEGMVRATTETGSITISEDHELNKTKNDNLDDVSGHLEAKKGDSVHHVLVDSTSGLIHFGLWD